MIKAGEAGHGSRGLKSQHLERQRQEDTKLQVNLAYSFESVFKNKNKNKQTRGQKRSHRKADHIAREAEGVMWPQRATSGLWYHLEIG